jgi:flavin reductase (DIM6/NTAB) family NADH-FMN oxidoreductase RutF
MAKATNAMDIQLLKRALGAFPTGVTVVTVFDDEQLPRGMTANAFSAVSLEPPQVLVCVNRSTSTHRLIEQAGRFGINILSRLTEEISRHCAEPGSDKRLRAEWLVAGAGTAPHLLNASAFLDCRIAAMHDAGTHSIIVGEVQEVTARDHEPLLYYRGAYREMNA